MRRTTKAALGIVPVVVVAFFFLIPAFYWFTQFSPAAVLNQPPTPIYKAYRSLGCMVLGYGDAYYPISVTFSINKPGGGIAQSKPTQGIVFSCEAPIMLV